MYNLYLVSNLAVWLQQINKLYLLSYLLSHDVTFPVPSTGASTSPRAGADRCDGDAARAVRGRTDDDDRRLPGDSLVFVSS